MSIPILHSAVLSLPVLHNPLAATWLLVSFLRLGLAPASPAALAQGLPPLTRYLPALASTGLQGQQGHLLHEALPD